MEISQEMIAIGQKAKDAARRLAFTGTETKNKALAAMAEALLQNQAHILSANAKDVEAAEKKGLKRV